MDSLLIVDDDPVYARMVREWTKDDYQSFVVVSGEQTLRFLSKRTVDMILLDFEMPEMSGPQVLEALRANPDTASIPVMFLSGATDEASLQKIESLNTSGFIPKTVKKEGLLERVAEVLER